MTDTQRIAKLEAELAELRRLVEHIAVGGPCTRGPDGKMIPIQDFAIALPASR